MIKNGVDIEKVSRFLNRDEDFFKTIFTDSEIKYCRAQPHPEQHFCGIYCAKEALSKALSDIVLDISYHDICVNHNAKGAPYFAPYDKFLNVDISLSISHTNDIAVASVILCCDTKNNPIKR